MSVTVYFECPMWKVTKQNEGLSSMDSAGLESFQLGTRTGPYFLSGGWITWLLEALNANMPKP